MQNQLYITQANIKNSKKNKHITELSEYIKSFNQNKAKDKWTLILQKIKKNFKYPQQYYKNILKPGFSFFNVSYILLVNDIKINIPETVVQNQMGSYDMIFTNQRGFIEKKMEISYPQFQQIVKINIKSHIKYLEQKHVQHLTFKHNIQDTKIITMQHILALLKNEQNPIIICRQADNEGIQFNDYPMNSKNIKHQSSVNSIHQRFIVSSNLKAHLIRLFFFPRYKQKLISNYGYRITNKKVMYKIQATKKTFIPQNLTINFNQQFSFDVIQLKGLGLFKYQFIAEQVVNYMEKSLGIRIKQIVFDFIIDNAKRIWLINMKMVEQQKCYLQKLNEDIQTLNQLTCSVFCKLCGIIFKKDDANKTLTYKLLWQLIQHLKKRNIFLTDIKINNPSTRPCRVCKQCYLLVVSQYQLINTEQMFAKLQNAPFKDKLIRVPSIKQPKFRPCMIGNKHFQWRLLIFIEEIKDLENSPKFPNIFQLQYELDNQKTRFVIPSNKQQSSTADYYSSRSKIDEKKKDKRKINQIRVHYFFSKDMNIGKYLNNTQLKFRLTENKDWKNYFAQGSSNTIRHFKNKYGQGQRHSTQIMLFFLNAKYCSFSLYVGLVCDGIYNTSNLNLFQSNEIYYSDNNYYNCNPFPTQWMEIWQPQPIVKQLYQDLDQIQNQEKDKQIKYQPKCSQKQLNQMLFGIGYNKKKKPQQESELFEDMKFIHKGYRKLSSKTSSMKMI